MSDEQLRRAERLAVTDPAWTRSVMARRERTQEPYDLTYLSFGAGVQSTALLAMCVQGEPGFPRPDVAIYADTQSELQPRWSW